MLRDLAVSHFEPMYVLNHEVFSRRWHTDDKSSVDPPLFDAFVRTAHAASDND